MTALSVYFICEIKKEKQVYTIFCFLPIFNFFQPIFIPEWFVDTSLQLHYGIQKIDFRIIPMYAIEIKF